VKSVSGTLASPLVLPEIAKPLGRKFAISNRILDVLVAEKLQAAENDLKQLMTDVTRAMEKAQEAVARIASKAVAATTKTESTTR
jgi:hypothetical protein